MTGTVIPLSQSFPERKPDQVTTYDLLSTSTIGYRANPDTLVGRHGLTIYSRMSNDEQVKAVLNFKRDAITARGWQFTFREDVDLSDDEQATRKRVFAEAVARMRGSFADALNTIMTGRAYGFSITEKVYGEIIVDGKAWPGINMLLGRDPLSFRFYTDEYGVLEKIEQQTARAGVIEVDRARVIHYVHAPEWDHVYGRSDLREAYRSWYIKDQISNLWPMYLERFAGGFLHASQAADANLTASELEKLEEALRKAKSLGAILTPPGVTLNVFQPGTTDGFERAIQFHDLAIAKALLVPNLLGISHTGSTGAYAQSQTQLEAFFWTLNSDATRLEECLNEQLFRDLGDQAWGDGEYPVFKFKPASLEHVKWVIGTWQSLLSAKAVVPTEDDEDFLRRLLEMPPRDDKEAVLENPIDKKAREDAAKQAEAQAQAMAAAVGGQRAPQPSTPAKGLPQAEDKMSVLAERIERLLFEWDESQHPREKDGKFAPKGGGGGGGGQRPKADSLLNPEKGNKRPVKATVPVAVMLSDLVRQRDWNENGLDAIDARAIKKGVDKTAIASALETWLDSSDVPTEYAKYIKTGGEPQLSDLDSDNWHHAAAYFDVEATMPTWLRDLLQKHDMFTRATFHLPGQHDQSSHGNRDGGGAGKAGGKVDPLLNPEKGNKRPVRTTVPVAVMLSDLVRLKDWDEIGMDALDDKAIKKGVDKTAIASALETWLDSNDIPTEYASYIKATGKPKLSDMDSDNWHHAGVYFDVEATMPTWLRDLVKKREGSFTRRAKFHLPGQHDQSSHGNRDGGSDKRIDPYNAPTDSGTDAAVLRALKQSGGEAAAAEYKGMIQTRDQLDARTQELDAQQSKAEGALQQATDRQAPPTELDVLNREVEKIYAEQEAHASQVEEHLGEMSAFLEDSLRKRGAERMSRRLHLTFVTAQERDDWLLRLRPGDALILPEAAGFSDEAPDDPHVTLVVRDALDDELPAQTRLVVRDKDEEGVAVELAR